MPQIPNDPIMLLSYINTQLRDNFHSLEELCASLNVEESLITKKLNSINYAYDSKTNQFK